MKNILFVSLALFFSCATGFAQEGKMVGGTFWNPAKQKNKPIGSPYLQNMFAPAIIDNIKTQANVRYNVFKDEFEFISKKGDTLVLDKKEDFASVTFNNNKKYRLTVYTNRENSLNNGYLIELYSKSDFTLYKKENINLIEGKTAKTTFEKDMPARYSKAEDGYFLKMPNGNTTEFPDSKKALFKMFPDKKQALETYFKENKIDFDNEGDLIKIIGLL